MKVEEGGSCPLYQLRREFKNSRYWQVVRFLKKGRHTRDRSLINSQKDVIFCFHPVLFTNFARESLLPI